MLEPNFKGVTAVGGVVGSFRCESSEDAVVKNCLVRGGSIATNYQGGGVAGSNVIAEILNCIAVGVQIVATNPSLGMTGEVLGQLYSGNAEASGLVALGGNVGVTKYGNRVIGYEKSDPTYDLLYALNTTTVNGTEVTSDDPASLDGATVTTSTIQDENWWKDTPQFDITSGAPTKAEPWIWKTGADFPVLRGDINANLP